MKDKPILFSAPMVRAILAGWKTQTRRTCMARTQNQADILGGAIMDDMNGADDGTHEKAAWERIGCPYGKPGDRLWVREEHLKCGHWEAVEGVKTKGGRQKWRFVPTARSTLFFDELPDDYADYRKGRSSKDPGTIAWHKRLARFMPRAASRITLEVVSVRVERLQEISEADAIVEGCGLNASAIGVPMPGGEREMYRKIWESINGTGSWAKNPFVWVVEFKRIGNTDAAQRGPTN